MVERGAFASKEPNRHWFSDFGPAIAAYVKSRRVKDLETWEFGCPYPYFLQTFYFLGVVDNIGSWVIALWERGVLFCDNLML